MFKVFKIMLLIGILVLFKSKTRSVFCRCKLSIAESLWWGDSIYGHAFIPYVYICIYLYVITCACAFLCVCMYSIGCTIIYVRYECLRHLHCTMYNSREKLILWINRNRVNMTRHKIKCMLWSWFTGLPHQQIKSYLPLTLNMEMIN